MLYGMGLPDPKIHESKVVPIIVLVDWKHCYPCGSRFALMVCFFVSDYRSCSVEHDSCDADRVNHSRLPETVREVGWVIEFSDRSGVFYQIVIKGFLVRA